MGGNGSGKMSLSFYSQLPLPHSSVTVRHMLTVQPNLTAGVMIWWFDKICTESELSVCQKEKHPAKLASKSVILDLKAFHNMRPLRFRQLKVLHKVRFPISLCVLGTETVWRSWERSELITCCSCRSRPSRWTDVRAYGLREWANLTREQLSVVSQSFTLHASTACRHWAEASTGIIFHLPLGLFQPTFYPATFCISFNNKQHLSIIYFPII